MDTVTDHKVLVNGPEDYYKDGDRRVLLLVGEEIHDQARHPQKNHLLVFGAAQELATLAHNSQGLIDSVNQAGGLAFIAHPVDPAAPMFNQPDISWTDWQVRSYTGIELWNGFSKFKSLLKTKFHAIFYGLNPLRVAHGPLPEALKKWDELLAEGRRVVAIGGSDAHAIPARLGPLRRIVFPYGYHFNAVNSHLLSPTPLKGNLSADRRSIMDALSKGHVFVGYDLPASTRGFRFTAQGMKHTAWMGDEISAKNGVTFQIRLPIRAECRLVRDGKVIKIWRNRETCTHITAESGVYRVEVYIHYLGSLRGWIFSNPIYVRD